MHMTEKHIVVIGGGITGLSAAFTLKQRADRNKLPLRCTILEQDNRLGGKIRTYREDGLVLEGGPDSMLARKPAGVNLIRELGIESEMVGTNPGAHKTYILHQGKLERLPPGTNMGIPTQFTPFATTKLLSLRGKARATLDLVIPPGPQDKDISLGRFLRRRLGDEVVNSIAEPLLAGIYAGSVDDLSLAATFPQFRAMEQSHRSLILGTLAARRAAKPDVSTTSGRSVFVTLRGGLQTVIERLYDCLHEWADIRMETAVHSIRHQENGRYLVETNGPDSPSTTVCDAVIVTVPADAAANLLAPVCSTARELKEIPYVSTATVIFGYSADSLQVDLDASGFVIPRGEKRHITACTWVSSKWPHTTSGGRVLIRCYVGRAGQQDELSLSDEAMATLVQRELRDILGIAARPWFTRVTRWDRAMPQYRVGHVERVRAVESSLIKSAPGVFICGAGYHGVGIPDCIADGTEAAQKAIEAIL